MIQFLLLDESICYGYSLEVPQCTLNICFCGVMRKLSVLFVEKKKCLIWSYVSYCDHHFLFFFPVNVVSLL